jgi:hypothetical protein
MRRLFKFMLIFLIAVFILPVAGHAVVWLAKDRPASWRDADWSASGVLPDPKRENEPVIHVMAARTGGYKGIVSVHSWLVVKMAGATQYDRYEVVGWGRPVRHNAYPPDGRWYSNPPQVVHSVRGDQAARAIPRLEAAIRSYRWADRGDYRIWPGPNSNTFVASMLAAVPDLAGRMPPTAIGRDFPADGNWIGRSPGGGWRMTLNGFAGITVGAVEGLELHLLGLVAGVDVARPALLLPGFGRIGS